MGSDRMAGAGRSWTGAAGPAVRIPSQWPPRAGNQQQAGGTTARTVHRTGPAWRRYALVAAGLAVVTTGAALRGTWTPDSPHYWRTEVQALSLRTAEWFTPDADDGAVPRALVRLAFRVHPDDLTQEEMARAATVLVGNGAPRAALQLWLGLAQNAFLAGDATAARGLLDLAHQQYPEDSTVVVSRVIAARGHADEAVALRDLVRLLPNHEIATVRGCRRALRSVAVTPPARCLRVSWVREATMKAHDEDVRLVAEIEALPARAPREIEEHLQSAQRATSLRTALTAERNDLLIEARQLGWRALGDVFIRLLPLPVEGDTMESYASRELVCLLPVIRVVCRGAAVSGALNAMQLRKTAIESRLNQIATDLSSCDALETVANAQVAYWSSDQPRRDREAERAALLPALQSALEHEERSRWNVVGIPIAQAIETVLAS